jgi:hypothetical protein
MRGSLRNAKSQVNAELSLNAMDSDKPGTLNECGDQEISVRPTDPGSIFARKSGSELLDSKSVEDDFHIRALFEVNCIDEADLTIVVRKD